jgi:rfaE bifunctional protein nucleotidyltransferase chain/domain
MNIEDKICTPVDAADLAKQLALLPRPMVMTNGVFDVLHRGHVNYLHRAAQLGASLVVAVNSDASARQLGKGPDRPLNTADDRACVLAGLASVSLVLFFDTATPVALLQEVHPDIYVKGGDYDMETLEETRVVRSWGGQSVAIPFVQGYSTTRLVQRIREPLMPRLRKAAFLDRDGVINHDKAYVHRWEDFEFIPGAIEAMGLLQAAGYALVVVTNQSGLARGYYTEAEYQKLSDALRQELVRHGVRLQGIYHCPHHPGGSVPHLSVRCHCRKPEPGMLLQAAQELGLDLGASVMVGDKRTDVQAARAAGVGRAYLVASHESQDQAAAEPADGDFADLLACTKALLSPTSQQRKI